MRLPTTSERPEYGWRYTTLFEREDCVFVLGEEFDGDGLLVTFRFPHSHAQSLSGTTLLNATVTVPTAARHKGREATAEVQITLESPVPLGQASGIGEGRPHLSDLSLIP